jgi:hypothetical protein
LEEVETTDKLVADLLDLGISFDEIVVIGFDRAKVKKLQIPSHIAGINQLLLVPQFMLKKIQRMLFFFLCEYKVHLFDFRKELMLQFSEQRNIFLRFRI